MSNRSSGRIFGFILLTLGFAICSVAQDLRITPGALTDVELFQSSVLEGPDEDRFHVYRLTYMQRSSEFDLSRMTLKEASGKQHFKIPEVDKKNNFFEELFYVGKDLFLCSRVINGKDKTHTVYMSKIEGGNVAAGVVVDQDPIKDSYDWENYANFSVVVSPDEQKIMLVKFEPYNYVKFTLKLMDRNLKLIWEKKIDLSAMLNRATYGRASDFILSDDGHVYFKSNEALEKTAQQKGKANYVVTLHCYDNKTSKLGSVRVNHDGLYVQNYQLKLTGKGLLFGAMLATNPAKQAKDYDVEKSFYAMADLSCTSIIAEKATDLTADHSEETRKNLLIRVMYCFSDNDIGIIAEQTRIKSAGMANNVTNSTIGTYMGYYYFDNVFIIKMGVSGWVQKIAKWQLSLDSPGDASIVCVAARDHIHIIYNVSGEEAGSHNNNNTATPPKAKKRMIADAKAWQVSVDKNGVIVKNALLEGVTSKLELLPRLGIQFSDSTSLLYAREEKNNRLVKIEAE